MTVHVSNWKRFLHNTAVSVSHAHSRYSGDLRSMWMLHSNWYRTTESESTWLVNVLHGLTHLRTRSPIRVHVAMSRHSICAVFVCIERYGLCKPPTLQQIHMALSRLCEFKPRENGKHEYNGWPRTNCNRIKQRTIVCIRIRSFLLSTPTWLDRAFRCTFFSIFCIYFLRVFFFGHHFSPFLD